MELDTYYNGDGLDSKLYVNGSSLQSIDSFYDHIAITNTDEIGKKILSLILMIHGELGTRHFIMVYSF